MAKKNNVNKFLKFRFGLRQRIKIYEKLMSYIKEGFPLFDSLVKFKARYDKNKDFKGKIIEAWLNRMKHGASFKEAVDGWIPEAELNLISSGEEGKGIEKGLEEAIKFAISSQKIKKTIITGSVYPIILLVVVLSFVGMFSVKMAPIYINILPIERWPDLGKNFYYFSKFLVDYWYIMLGGLIAFSVVVGMTMGSWTGNLRQFVDKLPPWSVYKVYQSSAFLISLSSMMNSGTPLNDSIKKMKRFASPWLNAYLDEMIRNLKRGGKNFGQHLNVGLLDDETSGDVIDYSELGKFEQAIYSMGEKNLEESVQKIESRMAMARNLMIVLVGVTVGIIYYTSVELNGAVADAASSNTQSMIRK